MNKHSLQPFPPVWILFASVLFNFIFLIPAINSLSLEGRDFQQDYVAAKRLIQREDIFLPATQEEISTLGVYPDTGIKSNFHPVTTLLYVIPLVKFNFQVAVYVWSLISIICFISGVYLLSTELNFPQLMYVSFFSFVWFPFWLHIRFGQFSAIIFLLLVLAWRTARKGNYLRSALFIFVATLAKIFPAFLLLPIILNRRWKTVILFCVLLISTIIAIFFWSPQSVLEYPEIMAANSQIFRGYYGNFGINGIVGRIFIGYSDIRPFHYSERIYNLFLIFITTIILLITIFYLLRVRDIDKQLSFSIVAMLLLSPTTWAHCWTILILPGVILFKTSEEKLYKKYRIGLLGILILSAFPHWQFLNWLKTIVPVPMSAWISLTPGGLYVLPCLFLLLVAEAIQRYWGQDRLMDTYSHSFPAQPG